MLGTLNSLIAATALFVGVHFVLSSRALRAPLVARMGEGPFLGIYSLIVVAAFAWMLLAFAAAPHLEVWSAPRFLAWLPIVIMPLACILVVAGLTTPNPTLAGGQLGGPADLRVSGVITITRHPFLWGTGLWALCHIPINGAAAPTVLFAGIAVLSYAGMAHIDARKATSLGAAWGPIALTTSVVPFAAAATKRTRVDWRGIGWPRVAGGLALYVVLFAAHAAVIGVDPHP